MAKAKMSMVISHWYHLMENFQTSPKEFYVAVEQAVKKRQVPDFSNARVDWKEGAIFSAKREYLRVRRKNLVFDICASPFGTGFFFSWWLGELPSGFWALMSTIPIFGWVTIWLFRRETYYKADTALMFQEMVRLSVHEVIDNLTREKGVRALSELERKPILRGLYR